MGRKPVKQVKIYNMTNSRDLPYFLGFVKI